MNKRAVSLYAKKLVSLSLENGSVSPERVQAVLDTLKANPPRKHLEILKAYESKLASQLRSEEAHVQFAGDIQGTLDALKSQLDKHYNRTLRVTTTENPDLLAGLRVQVADDVWDASARGRLDALSQNFKSNIP